MPPTVPARRAPRPRIVSRWALLLLPLTVACRTWRAEPLPVGGAPARAVRGHVRASRADGTRVELTRVRIARDTLRGEPRASGTGEAQRTPVVIPVDSLRGLERRRVSIERTVGLYFGVMGAFFFLAHAVGGETDAAGSR